MSANARITRSIVVGFVLSFAAGCAAPTSPNHPGPGPGQPGGDELAVFLVENESFRIRLDSPSIRATAHEVFARSARLIPIGRVIRGTELNQGWTWHLEDLHFVEAAAEVCDGRPSDVERAGGPAFGNGWYCPWRAEFVAILPLR